jgi:hypothetical protein
LAGDFAERIHRYLKYILSVSLRRNAVGWMAFIRKLLAFSGPGCLIAAG